jgi:membrane-associated protease RseP (regulator of RpoE activity)
MGFIVGILIIGALLSAIFGRRVGATFVTGTAALVLLGIGVLLLLLSPMIIDFFREPSHTGSSDGGYMSPSYGASNSTPMPRIGYSPVPPSTTPVYQSPATTAVGASAPLTVTATPVGPSIGITTQPADSRLSAQFSMSPGFGATVVSVTPGGPAAQAGLSPGDFIQAMDDDPITAVHTLTDYEARKGAGQPITLSVQHNDGSRWVHEWVKVTLR